VLIGIRWGADSVILFLLWIFMFGPKEDATAQATGKRAVTRPFTSA
jgi:hypothetical protein